MIVNQLTPLLPKDSEEVKRLRAMLDVATMVDPPLDRGDKRWGQDPDHRQSPRGDSTSIITPSEERGRDQDERDLHDIIYNKDAHNHFENWHQERDLVERERRDERDYDYYGPYYGQPHQYRSLIEGCNEGGSRLSHTT
jgi:hypothetical protein